MNLNRAQTVALALLLLLLPASSLPYWIQHTNWALDPSASPEQYRPAADGSRPGPGNPPLPVEVEILPLPRSMPDKFVDIAVKAVEHWDQVPGSAIRVRASTPEPSERYDQNWFERWSDEDGKNTIEFVTEDWPVWWGPSIVAITSPKLDPEGRIIEADIFCNAEHYHWVELPREGWFPDLAERNQVDVEAVLTHEMGHMLGLGHSQYEWACMYADVGLASTMRRHLTRDDYEGLRALYPGSRAAVPPPSIWGVHEDNFSDNDCKMGELQRAMAEILYVQRTTPLRGPHDMILDTRTNYPYCLFGAGFSDAMQDMDLSRSGLAQNAVTSEAYLGPNFVKAKVISGENGFPKLAVGAYDLTVTQWPGVTGILAQGLFINTADNELPQAVIQPDKERAEAETWVRLDGEGSADAESADLSYRWSVVESPPRTAGVLSSDTAAVTRLYLSGPGIYVVRLVVNDGTIDSIADQVVILASPAVSGGGDSDHRPFGCSIITDRGSSSASLTSFSAPINLVIVLALPLALGILMRNLLKYSSS